MVTAHKPTVVTHAVVSSFTGPNDVNLITACSTRLEIHTLGQQGLQAVLDVPIYGHVSALQSFRPRDQPTDLLFVLTEKYKFFIIKYNAAKGRLETCSHGDVSDRIGRPAENGQVGLVDPACRCIALHLYDGILKIIPMDERTGACSEAFNVRLEELCVIDMVWLHPHTGGAGPSTSAAAGGSGPGSGRPLLCVLYQEPKGARNVKTYEVALGAKDIVEGPWQQPHVDSGAQQLVPVPSPLGGVLVLGENAVSYLGGGPGGAAPPVSAPIKQTIVKAWCHVDADGSRVLLGDMFGALSLLVVAHDGAGRVSGLRIEHLGHVTSPSCLAYLDSGLTFVGSEGGDSQLVRISATPVNQPATAMEEDEEGGGAAVAAVAEPPSYVEVVDSYPNLGPIVDFAVMDLDRQGQGQVVTCSGRDGDGSLRVIRNGIGINKQAAVELSGIKGVWSLRSRYSSEHDTYLVLTFVGETRLLALNEQEELDEAVLPGFDDSAQTLWCGNTATDHLVQVTSSAVRLVDCSSLQLVGCWSPPAGSAISVAAGSPTQVVVAVGGGQLVYLEVAAEGADGGGGGGVELREVARATLGAEVACVDITPLGASSDRAALVAVGGWDQSLTLLTAPQLAPLGTTPLGGEVIPRSVLLVELEGVAYCMVGLGDGALHTWRLEPATGALLDRKRVVLGTRPIALRTFRTGGAAAGTGAAGGRNGSGPGGTSVFAASDRPTVVYSSNKKLLYSNLNENDVLFLASFHSAPFPHSLAVASEGLLTIGTVDPIQKLHVRTVALGEQPRRIAHHPAGRTLAVLTHRTEPDGEVRAHVRFLDDTTFEVVASHTLAPREDVCSLAALPHPCPPPPPGQQGPAAGELQPAVFVVGTAVINPEEQEPSRGRLLVLEYDSTAAGGPSSGANDARVRVVTEREVKGAPWSVLPFAGDKLLVAVKSKVTVYRWVSRDGAGSSGGVGSTVELASECVQSANVMALYLSARGNLVLVGDLMRSVSLLSYNAEQGTLEHRAADYSSGWTTAVEMLDDDTYVAADNHSNMYVVRRNAESAADEERARLQVVGEFHTGCFINRFRRGSLVMRLPDASSDPLLAAAAAATAAAASAGGGAGGGGGPLPQPLLFGTTDGRLGVMAQLPQPLYDHLSKLQSAVRQVVQGVGGLSHEAWRAFANDRRTADAHGFIDGDLIETFLDLGPEDAARVASLVGPEATVEEITRRVEDLARALH